MAGRLCAICANAAKAAEARKLITEGVSDEEIARRIGMSSRSAVQRHRVDHVLAPARAVADAAARGRPVQEERARVLQHAAEGTLDPADYLGLAAIIADLKRTGDRLERVAAEAEAGGQHGVVAPIAGQQIRAVETRARLGGIGGYAPARTPQPGEGAPGFTVNFQFSDGRTERITAGAPAIDAEPGAGSLFIPEFIPALRAGPQDEPVGVGRPHYGTGGGPPAVAPEARAEPVRRTRAKQTRPTKAEPAKVEPVRRTRAKQTRPTKAAPARVEPARAEPQGEPTSIAVLARRLAEKLAPARRA